MFATKYVHYFVPVLRNINPTIPLNSLEYLKTLHLYLHRNRSYYMLRLNFKQRQKKEKPLVRYGYVMDQKKEALLQLIPETFHNRPHVRAAPQAFQHRDTTSSDINIEEKPHIFMTN